MKNFLNTLSSLFESIGKARAAAHLARCGLHKEARDLMLAK
jgi:hypothetical protein